LIKNLKIAGAQYYTESFPDHLKGHFFKKLRVCEELDTRPTGNIFLFCSSWIIKISLNIWRRHRISVELERLGKFQFLFKTNLGYESGDKVHTFDGEETLEVKFQACIYFRTERWRNLRVPSIQSLRRVVGGNLS
jgi:hypothetical protein